MELIQKSMYYKSKEKYEKLNIDTKSEMNLDISGEYKMMNNRIMEYKIQFIAIGVFIILIIIGVITYVVIKKKYWFW